VRAAASAGQREPGAGSLGKSSHSQLAEIQNPRKIIEENILLCLSMAFLIWATGVGEGNPQRGAAAAASSVGILLVQDSKVFKRARARAMDL